MLSAQMFPCSSSRARGQRRSNGPHPWFYHPLSIPSFILLTTSPLERDSSFLFIQCNDNNRHNNIEFRMVIFSFSYRLSVWIIILPPFFPGRPSLCVGNSPVTGEFPSQRPVTQNFVVFVDLCPNIRLSKNCEAGILRRHRAHYDTIVMRGHILSHLSPHLQTRWLLFLAHIHCSLFFHIPNNHHIPLFIFIIRFWLP